jgi:hypothetical protein
MATGAWRGYMRDEHYGIPVPTVEQLQQRWEQFSAQFEMWTQIWRANPQLAKQSGKRVEEMMAPVAEIYRRAANYTK